MVEGNPSKNSLDQLCNEILSLIEINETRLLDWGFVEVQADLENELPSLLNNLSPEMSLVWRKAQEAGYKIAHVLDNLKQRKLVLTDGKYYRSRFAEAVRLFYLLRQRFSENDWQTASRLVSDIRIQLRRRRFPRRDITAQELITNLKSIGASADYATAVDHLLKDEDGNHLMLARFQKAAILEQFQQLRSGGDQGLVIGAGTGTGKTKAFYIPAMAELAGSISGARHINILAIYPRTELLKDQLAEAFQESRKLDSYLKEKGKRLISVGAYYGDTLYSAESLLKYGEKKEVNGWKLNQDKTGWVCPFFICPHSSCLNREMVWSSEAVTQETKENKQNIYGKHARLVCSSCHYEVSAEQLLLTRQQMVRTPPDILFTTTEMLNRKLGDSHEHALFGIGTQKPPRLMLLDEIHTYEGLSGAQVAYLLRRWKAARGNKNDRNNLCIVGLSATLRDAVNFFSGLTGIPERYVAYIEPADEDLLDEGMEYNLVLKGDPVSGTSLLSTSVQAAMLLGRILDPISEINSETASHGTIGQKIFAFSDKLDIINRWYDIEDDAERIKNLSQYRKESRNLDSETITRMKKAGQIWKVCEWIGHNLRTPLRLGLTSSQYRGVQTNADLIIATSSLEVGFNDITVGAVLQHKAPRSLASFLQRKGRAGRTRSMRPWMVVVASSYGRDRWAFQHAENLFNPLLPPLDLPIHNYYVQKIQSVYALLDWIAYEFRKKDINVDVWGLCTNKGTGSSDYSKQYVPQACSLLEGILNGKRRYDFVRYLEAALSLQDDATAVESILWGEPRPLLLEVIPTLLRQLEGNWRILKGKATSLREEKSSTPLPKFLPSALFSDLNLPEVILHIPVRETVHADQQDPRDESMSLSQGLTEFAPGNVSKRFSIKGHRKEAHWLPLPEDAQLSRGMLPLQYLPVSFDPVPEILTRPEGPIPIFRPLEYNLAFTPKEIRDTSQASLIWHSHFAAKSPTTDLLAEAHDLTETENGGFEVHLALTANTQWHRLIKDILSYTQVNGSWVRVTRYATGVDVDTRFERGNSVRRKLFFEDDGQPAAIGFTLDVDALEFIYEPLDKHALIISAEWPKVSKTLLSNYFKYRLHADKRLREAGLSNFDLDWTWQLEFSMLTAVAIAKNISLQEASVEVNLNRSAIAERTMKVIFQSQQQGERTEDDDEGRLFKRLKDFQSNQSIADAVCDCERVLWEQPDDAFYAWLSNCYASSLGAAIFTAVSNFVSDIQKDDLSLDVEEDKIWISETIAGGVGLISKIADTITRYPREFELQLEDTLQYCEKEQLSSQLEIIAEKINYDDSGLSQVFKELRISVDLPKVEATRRVLEKTLKSNGIPVRRELLVALNTKFLRPNSDHDSDQLISSLVEEWKNQEARLGLTIDLRVIAVAASKIPRIKEQIDHLIERTGGGTYTLDESQVFNLLQSMLWLKCQDSCSDCIEVWNVFQDLPHPSRALIKVLIDRDLSLVRFEDVNRVEKILDCLTKKFQVTLACSQAQLQECKKFLLDMLVKPIEIGYQEFYPLVERIIRSDQGWETSIVIKEILV